MATCSCRIGFAKDCPVHNSEKLIHTVTFTDKTDGEGPWTVTVDSETIIEGLRSDHMDIADTALDPLWEALGVEIDFVWKGKK